MTFYLAPAHDIRAPLLALVDQAKSSILIEIFGFALPALCDRLIAAKERGVCVRILFDYRQALGPGSRELVKRMRAAGIECWIGMSPRHQIRHSKFMIIDGEIVEHGSLNYSEVAFRQNNTVVITRDRELAQFLTADWEQNRAWLEANQADLQERL